MNKKCFVCKFAIFLEKEFIQEGSNNRKIELKELSDETQTNSDPTPVPDETEPTNVPQPLRRSSRVSVAPERYGFLVTQQGDVLLIDQDEPKTYEEAIKDSDFEKWLEAMRSEMDSMDSNQF